MCISCTGEVVRYVGNAIERSSNVRIFSCKCSRYVMLVLLSVWRRFLRQPSTRPLASTVEIQQLEERCAATTARAQAAMRFFHSSWRSLVGHGSGLTSKLRLHLSPRLQEPPCRLDYSIGTRVSRDLETRSFCGEVHTPTSAKKGGGIE